MATKARWNGTDAELKQLRNAIRKHCVCEPEDNVYCRAHELLETDDQRALDHLLFVHRAIQHYLVAEFEVKR